MQIPANGGVGAVDFKRVQRLVPARVSGGLKQAKRAVGKVAVENARVVDADCLLLAGGGVHAFLDERLGHSRHVADAAVEPDGGVDAVRQQVTGHAAAGCVHVQPPQPLSALRQISTDGPVLQKVGTVVEDLAKLAGVDDLLGQGDGRDAAVVVPHRVRHAGLLDGIHHRRTLLRRARQRLLAQHHLARLGGGDGDLGVKIIRRADVNRVDVVALHQFAPIALRRFKAPLLRKRCPPFLVARTDGLEHRALAEIRKKVVDALVTVRVSAAHEAVAHESDVEWFFFAHGS